MGTFRQLSANRSGSDKTDFSGTDIFHEELHDQHYVNCLFNGAHFRNTKGVRLDCRHVEFSDAIFDDCQFENCRFDHSDFVTTTLTNCVFRRCTFENGEWRTARLRNCTFDFCDFADATVSLCGFAGSHLGTGFLSTNRSHGKRYNVLLDCLIADDSTNDLFVERNLIFEHDAAGSPTLRGHGNANSTLGVIAHLVATAQSLADSAVRREASLRLRQLVLAGEVLVSGGVLPLLGVEYLADELIRSVGARANTEAFLEVVRLVALCRSHLASRSREVNTAIEPLCDLRADEIVAKFHFDKSFVRKEIDLFVSATLRLSEGTESIVRSLDVRRGSTILTLVLSGVLGVAALVKAITFLLARTDTLIDQVTRLRRRLKPKRQVSRRRTSRRPKKNNCTELALPARDIFMASESDPSLARLHRVVVEMGPGPLRVDGNVVIRISIEQGTERISVQ
jgi:hypothetical protein